MQQLRKAFIRWTGYWIYKKKHLTTGVDVLIDLENHFPKEFEEIETVFDVGANTGQSAVRFAEELKRAKIHSFEPEPDTFAKLEYSTSRHPRVHCHNLGLADVKGQMKLHIGRYSAWNSLIPDINNTENSVMIEVSTMDDMVQLLGIDRIDLLKTDTEGFDLQVLKGAEQLLSKGKIRFIYIEAGFYPDNPRNTSFTAVAKYLERFGLQLFAFYEMSKGGSSLVNGNALFVHHNAVSSHYRIG